MCVILLECGSATGAGIRPIVANTLVPTHDPSILLGESVGSGGSAWVLIGAGLLLLIVLRRLRGSA